LVRRFRILPAGVVWKKASGAETRLRTIDECRLEAAFTEASKKTRARAAPTRQMVAVRAP